MKRVPGVKADLIFCPVPEGFVFVEDGLRGQSVHGCAIMISIG
jgi:hypothetical protein